MRRSRQFAIRASVGAGVFFLCLSIASDAWAFCRTRTVKESASCVRDESGCCTEGLPLYWESACVGYSLQSNAAPDISFDAAATIVSRAFTAWTGVSCPSDNGISRVGIDVRDLGKVDCGQVAVDSDGPNQHTIVFRDDYWNHEDKDNVLGLTTVTFERATGKITNADMELNNTRATKFWAEPSSIMPDGFDDLLSVVTHEAGHFLGLAHSSDPHATMFAQYDPGTYAMRNLRVDDVRGICSAYLPGGQRVVGNGERIDATPCDPTPMGGLTGQCKEPESCSLPKASARDASSASSRVGLVALALLLAVLMRRRKVRAG